MAKGWMDIIIDKILDDEWVGKHGEKLTEKELKLVKLLGRKGKTLRNVYLPKDNGETSEVDLIYITQKGIFVFESKNYSGWIFGDEKSKNWTAMLPNKQKNQFYNPILQNKTHLKWIKNFVGDNIPLFSIIVFSERCELKKVTVESEDIRVIKRDRTYATVRDIWDNNPDVVPDSKIDELYVKLKELTKVDKATKSAHSENIEKKYKSLDDVANDNAESESTIVNHKDGGAVAENELICPKCGNKLILRVAKKGENAGNQFYGCSAFPKCRYIQNL
ncbi:MAG: NERD domain-containing protein [Lachnospiraceae bacterium]|nr:NERD domain-containing protein [Lachnospiraceae bacterium]